MATYTQHVHDIASGEIIEHTITDAEIIAGAVANQITLSADKTSITGDGVDVCTITVQLVSAPLADDSQTNIAEARTVIVVIDGDENEIALGADGSEAIALTSVADGDTIAVTVAGMVSNTLDIEVT